MEVMVRAEESLLLLLSCVAFIAWTSEFCGEVEGHEDCQAFGDSEE